MGTRWILLLVTRWSETLKKAEKGLAFPENNEDG